MTDFAVALIKRAIVLIDQQSSAALRVMTLQDEFKADTRKRSVPGAPCT